VRYRPVGAKDRDGKDQGFTHKTGDLVTVASPKLGKLVNRMRTSDACEPWSFGIGWPSGVCLVIRADVFRRGRFSDR
jgi:hypothetical protein